MSIRPVRHPDDLRALERLFSICHDADGHWPLGEHKYLSLVQGGVGPSRALVAESEGEIVGYAHLSPNREDRGWGIEMAVHPLWRSEPIATTLLEEALGAVENAGGSSVRFWVFRPALAGTLQDLGFRQERELRQLRCHLPVDSEGPLPPGVVLKPFVPGADEAAWLEVNNRAFAGHPENGAWTEEVLADRQAQTWFDASGFLMAWEEDRLVGFCWTKVHKDDVGEIYVIAVHPDAQRRGLGLALAVAGLDYLHDQRGCQIGMLYVDAANTEALALYERIGFWVDHIDRSLVKTL